MPFVAIEAHLLDEGRSRQARRHRRYVSCPEGEVPDSATARCLPSCPDGSPRHDDACAVADDCRDGYVNLVGLCVLAATKGDGRDASTGISFRCGPGGCSYSMPRGQGGCPEATCSASCPAPSFRLARDKRGLTCVE
jgi:hypothetical protein